MKNSDVMTLTGPGAIQGPLGQEGLHASLCRELRCLADCVLTGELELASLRSTELIREAFRRLPHPAPVTWPERTRLLAVGAQEMRRILVQHAQKRQRKGWIARRRPGVEWTDDGGALLNQPKLILAIDRAIQKLFRLDSLHARILECRFFGGMSVEEIAAALSQETRTAERHWWVIRAWTRRELADGRGA